jgi:ABC-2 type transport system ATP-binding protein
MQGFLDIKHVSKRYHNALALDDVSLSLPKGKVFGLLGPNGAGKTTLIRIITQILGPDAGEVWFEGENLAPAHRALIGYMPEERGLYRKMKVGEQLLYLAQLKGLSAKAAREQTIAWMRKLDIGNWWNKKIDELSKGMSQKVQFISTVIHHPPLLILDEPFSGLDPINANLLKNEILELKANGTTIIFSTHRMESVEEMCDHIALINKGKVILDGPVAEIQQTYKHHHYEVAFQGSLPELGSFSEAFPVVRQNDTHIVFQLQQGQTANELLRSLIAVGTDIHGLREILPSVSDIFIQKVGEYA